MSRFVRALIAAGLSVAVGIAPARVSAEESLAPSTEAPAAQAETAAAETAGEEARWREEVNEAKRSKSTFQKAGVITSVAALGLLVAGNVRVSSADDIEGCERDGSDIVCRSQDAADDANARLDQGRGLYIAGLATGLVGLALLVTSTKRSNRIDELERTGRRRGYKLSLDAGQGDRLQLVLSREF